MSDADRQRHLVDFLAESQPPPRAQHLPPMPPAADLQRYKERVQAWPHTSPFRALVSQAPTVSDDYYYDDSDEQQPQPPPPSLPEKQKAAAPAPVPPTPPAPPALPAAPLAPLALQAVATDDTPNGVIDHSVRFLKQNFWPILMVIVFLVCVGVAFIYFANRPQVVATPAAALPATTPPAPPPALGENLTLPPFYDDAVPPLQRDATLENKQLLARIAALEQHVDATSNERLNDIEKLQQMCEQLQNERTQLERENAELLEIVQNSGLLAEPQPTDDADNEVAHALADAVVDPDEQPVEKQAAQEEQGEQGDEQGEEGGEGQEEADDGHVPIAYPWHKQPLQVATEHPLQSEQEQQEQAQQAQPAQPEPEQPQTQQPQQEPRAQQPQAQQPQAQQPGEQDEQHLWVD